MQTTFRTYMPEIQPNSPLAAFKRIERGGHGLKKLNIRREIDSF